MTLDEQQRQALATEVIEMGEQLFAWATEIQIEQHSAADPTLDKDFPIVELEQASHEFFTALRLLLT